MVVRVEEAVEVALDEHGDPVGITWRERRFRVNDTPTTLVGPCDWWRPFAGSGPVPGRPPLEIAGWRFQAVADDGETHVFDVGFADRRWQLLRVFD